MATNKELQAENDQLRAELAQLRQGATAQPSPPSVSFEMSEGLRNDIELAQARIAQDPKLTKVTLMDVLTGQPVVVTEHDYVIGGNEGESPVDYPPASTFDPNEAPPAPAPTA